MKNSKYWTGQIEVLREELDVADNTEDREAFAHELFIAKRELARALEGEKKETKCRCRKPKTHRDCMYCGCGWAGEVICGVCKEQGIDGKLIRGTGRVVCSMHKN